MTGVYRHLRAGLPDVPHLRHPEFRMPTSARVVDVVASLGTAVAMAALVVLGATAAVAVAVPSEPPTVTVTYDR